MSEVFNPGSTYRVQFHKDFTFKHLEAIASYLQELGIQTLYASPIFKAFPGSNHGYDGTDPNQINPEIGTEEELVRLAGDLNSRGIHWIQDIVPNHLAYHHDNKWLMDVLEKGSKSDKARYFDIDWHHPVNTGKLMAPFLATRLEEEISNGNLQLSLNLVTKKYYLRYFNNCFAVDPDSIRFLQNDSTLASTTTNKWQTFDLSAQTLKEIANKQHYELCGWFETDKRINFRRFFTVNGLICTNIQDPAVFENYHGLIKKLIDQNVFQGLRIDHVDGLYDPGKYLSDLRKLAGDATYIVVEKILAHRENLPGSWPIQGTSGYDFLAMVNNVLTNKESEVPLTEFYNWLIKDEPSIHHEITKKKSHILFHYMNGELDNLIRLYRNTVAPDLKEENIAVLRKDIADYLINCPVYRFYDDIPLMKRDENKNKEATRAFYQRCMQFTGPLMAKGVEDTLMYTYNRFIGHNDVGDSPEYFGTTTDEFHQQMQERQVAWPMALNTTSTHDTKRGEDARTRLNALTDLDSEWLLLCAKWRAENQSLKTDNAPDDNDEYFIYQTLISTYPFADDDFETYYNRLTEYFPKAFREGKVNSNWSSPNKDYEDAAANFIGQLFKKNTFRESFFPFLEKVKTYGILNSLVQTVLKFTCPGVPDLYQGTEMWDLSLVDPDNRRPVNYTIRKGAFEPDRPIEDLWKSRDNGGIKLQLVRKLLLLRKRFSVLFKKGSYSPVQVTGALKHHILAFERAYQDQNIIVIVPLHTGKLAESQKTIPVSIDWKDTQVLPDRKDAGSMTELISGREIPANNAFRVQDLFSDFPIAVVYDLQV